MFENNLKFYSRPAIENRILKKYNDKFYLVEKKDLITGQTSDNNLLDAEEIQETLNNQESILEVVNGALEYEKKQQQRRREAEDKEKQEQENYNHCYGYCDNKKPLQAGKILKVLNKNVKIDGTYTTRKEFIYNKIKEGYKPIIIDKLMTNERKVNLERVATYKYNVPALEKDGYYTITKTEYNFAMYLLDEVLQPA